MNEQIKYVPPRVAATRLGVSTRTLERWRGRWQNPRN
ncbi:helix-turn-helix domain-containing protein [Moorena sp. SIO3H5]